jgi:hypothetical protein
VVVGVGSSKPLDDTVEYLTRRSTLEDEETEFCEEKEEKILGAIHRFVWRLSVADAVAE